LKRYDIVVYEDGDWDAYESEHGEFLRYCDLQEERSEAQHVRGIPNDATVERLLVNGEEWVRSDAQCDDEAERKRADALWQQCENYRIVIGDLVNEAKHFSIMDRAVREAETAIAAMNASEPKD